MKYLSVAAILLVVGFAGCTRSEDDSAAREAGRAAHKVATKTEEVAKKAGEKIEKAAKEAREGWKEASREDREKKGK